MNRSPWKPLLVFTLLNLVLLAFVLPSLEPGTAERTIALFSLSLLIPVLIGLLAVIHWEWNPF